MKPLNSNRANLLLLFTRDPFVKLMNKELEYYSSDDDSLIGFVSLDREDYTFHAMLFDRDSRNKYCLVYMKLDYCSIEEARLGLEKLVKTEYIHPPKTGISIHFCVLSLMAMQK